MPVIHIERPKMSVEMWEAIKLHILKSREKKKQEQEQDERQEKHRIEQELKRKRDAMTLEEIKEQLVKLEVKLEQLRVEKHEVFNQLKKVLNNDDVKKTQREPEFLPPQQVLAVQTLASQSYPHPYFIPQALVNTPSRQPQSNIYQRLTPMSTAGAPMVTATTSQAIMNTAQTIQSTPRANTSPANLSNIKRTPTKRPHESPSDSPPTTIPYSGAMPMYKTSVSYTPNIPKTSPSSHYQLYYPSGVPPQVAFDAKGNPYHILPSGAAFPAENQTVEQSEYEASKYYHQFRGMAPMLPAQAPIIPIQAGQSKPGGITSGFPVQRVGVSMSSNVMPGQPLPNREQSRQYPRYY